MYWIAMSNVFFIMEHTLKSSKVSLRHRGLTRGCETHQRDYPGDAGQSRALVEGTER